jgi:pimeloyl-ACP methyl ester carboxylesterase
MTKTTKRTTRRAVLGVGAGLTSTALLGGLIRPAKAQAGGNTFVLVHGAWRGGWCWRKVADLLTAKGHKVYTPTLTGLGERSHLMSGLINLDTHTNDIVNVVKWEGLENFVLVGHSYGGWPISAAAEHLVPKIASIVFLDAFYPSNGQRGLDLQSEQSSKDVLAAVGRGEVGRTGPSAKAFGNNEANWPWIDANHTAADWSLAAADWLDRGAGEGREEDLHQGEKLSERPVRQAHRRIESDSRVENLRGGVRPRCHD